MNTSNMKNIVILKDLPSNLIDEAIIFLKQNQRIRKAEYVENTDKFKEKEKGDKKSDFLVNEAKLVIADYILNVEKNKYVKNNVKSEKKYNRLKGVNIILLIALILSIFINFI